MHLGDGGIDWISFSDLLVLEPTRADRCTYVAYDGIEGKKDKSYLSSGSFSLEKEPEPEPSGHLKDLALHAMSCYAYDEESRSTSDRAEVRSYMSCQDIAQCFNTENQEDGRLCLETSDRWEASGFLGQYRV